MDNIKDAIRKLAQQDGETVALVCTVDAVDKKARTIDCTPVNEGAPLLGGLMLATDKIESAEMVIGETAAAIDAEGVRVKTAKMSADINKEDIIFNGGELDGLVIIQKLTDKLNELKDTVNSLINAYNNHTHITTATVGTGPAGTISPTTSKAQTAKPFKKSDYENTKIKQ